MSTAIEILKLVWIYFFMEFVKASSIQTIPSLDVVLGHSPTLTCTYTYEIGSNYLIFIRWSRKMEDNSDVPLALMKVGRDPEWLDSAPKAFKDNVTLLPASGDNYMSFNLRIEEFTCMKEGTYECEIFTYTETLKSSTELIAKAPPGPPRIHDDVIQVKENDSFYIHCQGNVGIPPVTLRWSYKSRNTNVYQLVTDGVKQENSPSRDCLYQGSSSVRVVMSEELDGAVFLCATSAELGDHADPDIYDKVELQLHRTTTTTTPTTTTKCPGKSCNEPSAIIDDGNNKAAVYTLSVSRLCLVLVLTTVLSRTFCIS